LGLLDYEKSIDNILGKDKKKKSKMKNSSILEPALREQEIEVDYEDYDEFDNDDQISRNQEQIDNDEFDIDQIMGYQNENLNDKDFNDKIKILIDQTFIFSCNSCFVSQWKIALRRRSARYNFS
jgi:hypothetical protein